MFRFFKDYLAACFGFKIVFVLLVLMVFFSSAGAREVSLQWDSNSEPDLNHYVVHWGSNSGSYTSESGDIGLVTSYTCSLPDNGGTYYFAVTAVDDTGLSSDFSNEVSTDNITGDVPPDSIPDDSIDVPDNNPPIAAAGPDQNVNEGSVVYMNGANSSDPDGDSLTYVWIQVSGPSVTLDNSTTDQPSFDAPYINSEGESMGFQLTVTDESGFQATDSCIVNIVFVNNPPTANAGPDQNVNEGSMVYLDGSNSSDPDGDYLTYKWVQISGPSVPLDNSTNDQPLFDAPYITSEGGSLVFQLTVTDQSGLQSTDTCIANIVSVNSPPTASAGPDQNVNEGSMVYLNGSNSSDPDGDLLTHQWIQVTGPAVSLTDSTSAQPEFESPSITSEGDSLVFQLTVFDQDGLRSTDSCIVNIVSVNNPPTASAGSDQNEDEGSVVYLDGSGSIDPDGDMLSYQWSQVSGTSVTLSDPASPKPEFDAFFVDAEGESLTFQLTVTDPDGLKSTDTCIVNILWVNKPPVADAGPAQEIDEGSFISLIGSGSSDPDGDALTYQWIQTSGVAVTINDPNAELPSVVSSQDIPSGETLIFQLTVTDSGGLKSTDQCSVAVISPANYDITGDWASLYPVERKRKSWISGGFNLTNFGNQINQPFHVSFYLSGNDLYDSGDTQIDGQVVGVLAEYETINITLDRIKFNGAVIGKYIICIIDSNDQIAEEDESNNMAVYLIR